MGAATSDAATWPHSSLSLLARRGYETGLTDPTGLLARVKDLRAGTGASASLEQTKKNIQKRIKAAVR